MNPNDPLRTGPIRFAAALHHENDDFLGEVGNWRRRCHTCDSGCQVLDFWTAATHVNGGWEGLLEVISGDVSYGMDEIGPYILINGGDFNILISQAYENLARGMGANGGWFLEYENLNTDRGYVSASLYGGPRGGDERELAHVEVYSQRYCFGAKRHDSHGESGIICQRPYYEHWLDNATLGFNKYGVFGNQGLGIQSLGGHSYNAIHNRQDVIAYRWINVYGRRMRWILPSFEDQEEHYHYEIVQASAGYPLGGFGVPRRIWGNGHFKIRNLYSFKATEIKSSGIKYLVPINKPPYLESEDYAHLEFPNHDITLIPGTEEVWPEGVFPLAVKYTALVQQNGVRIPDWQNAVTIPLAYLVFCAWDLGDIVNFLTQYNISWEQPIEGRGSNYYRYCQKPGCVIYASENTTDRYFKILRGIVSTEKDTSTLWYDPSGNTLFTPGNYLRQMERKRKYIDYGGFMKVPEMGEFVEGGFEGYIYYAGEPSGMFSWRLRVEEENGQSVIVFRTMDKKFYVQEGQWISFHLQTQEGKNVIYCRFDCIVEAVHEYVIDETEIDFVEIVVDSRLADGYVLVRYVDSQILSHATGGLYDLKFSDSGEFGARQTRGNCYRLGCTALVRRVVESPCECQSLPDELYGQWGFSFQLQHVMRELIGQCRVAVNFGNVISLSKMMYGIARFHPESMIYSFPVFLGVSRGGLQGFTIEARDGAEVISESVDMGAAGYLICACCLVAEDTFDGCHFVPVITISAVFERYNYPDEYFCVMGWIEEPGSGMASPYAIKVELPPENGIIVTEPRIPIFIDLCGPFSAGKIYRSWSGWSEVTTETTSAEGNQTAGPGWWLSSFYETLRGRPVLAISKNCEITLGSDTFGREYITGSCAIINVLS